MAKIAIDKIAKDYKRAGRFCKKWKKEAEEDLRFCLGEQWDKEIKETIERQGRPALTLNIIQPNIRMIAGYQRDSRSTIRAFPEGGEDSVTSEIVTKLIKNVNKKSKTENVMSEAFEMSLMARGKAFIEPYVDYTYDLLNGTLQFNVLDGWQVRIDPNSVKYDLSDANYVTKERKYTKEEIMELHPTKKKDIEEGINKPLPEDDGSVGEESLLEKGEDYPNTLGMDESTDEDDEDDEDDKTYKYIIYYYKKWITKYLAVDVEKSIAQFFTTEKKAKQHLLENTEGETLGEGQKVIPKRMPEIWMASTVGHKILDDRLSDSYPNWRSYPIIPLFAWYSAVGKRVLKREDLAFQGIASALKDPQVEKNKRRSQSLHIINTVANSGWLSEEGAWVNREDVKAMGSTPGVDLNYRKGSPKPERLTPSSLPSSHVYFEEKSEEDIKTISGINPDMLSVKDKTTSGRAIALRQQQGLKILKPLFDNLTWTQEILGKYIVSQLSELYTVDKAMKVLGGEFVEKHFRRNESDTPELMMAMAGEAIKNILDDPDLANYDISIGEGMESPTERYAQYTSMLDLAGAGVPIPPQVLITYSDMPEAAKQETIAALTQQPQGEQPQSRSQGARKPVPKAG